MKTLATATIGMILTAATLSAQAGADDRHNLAQCNTEIERVLGVDARTRLAGIKSRRSGDRLRMKVIPGQGDSLVVNCTVDREGIITLVTSDGLALTTPAFDDADKVSLSN